MFGVDVFEGVLGYGVSGFQGAPTFGVWSFGQ